MDEYVQLSTDYWDIHMFELSHVTAIIFKQGKVTRIVSKDVEMQLSNH